jgi:hypothetical protein
VTRRAAGRVAVALAFLALGGCGTPSEETTSCGSGSRQLVESFVDSFNRGDAWQLDRLVSQSGFGWYSTDGPGERINHEANDRSSLLGYFAQRHSHSERLELRSFQFTGISLDGRGNFEFELTRSSNDGLDATPYGGKGASDCERSPFTLVVWSMAREPFLRADVPRYLALFAILLIALTSGVMVHFRRRRLPR